MKRLFPQISCADPSCGTGATTRRRSSERSYSRSATLFGAIQSNCQCSIIAGGRAYAGLAYRPLTQNAVRDFNMVLLGSPAGDADDSLIVHIPLNAISMIPIPEGAPSPSSATQTTSFPS